MVLPISRRTLTSFLFVTLFAISAADKPTIDTILDKIAISPSELSNIVRLSSKKHTGTSNTTLFSILFPSSRPAINALLATAYISGPPNFLLALCPPNIDPSSLSIMVAFAVGGLLGDTFFHLLPEIFLGEDSDDSVRIVALEPNRNLLLGVWIFVGLATFMAMDKTLRIATGAGHSHSHTGDGKGHGNAGMDSQARDLDYRLTEDLQKVVSNETQQEHEDRLANKPYNDTMVDGVKTKDIVSSIAEKNRNVRKRKGKSDAVSEKSVASEKSMVEEVTEPIQEVQQEPEALLKSEPTKLRDQNPSVKLAGLLNLIADFTHNITDGLALSTSFYSSPALGATTTMAVFFHEIPHEVGDFALLIQSGFTKRTAMGAQFVTAIGAFIGTIIGILVQEYGSGDATVDGPGLMGTSLQWSDVLLPFTAGTFLYVGTVGVIPELLENEPGKTRMEEFQRTMMQFGAMAVGALIMVAISWN